MISFKFWKKSEGADTFLREKPVALLMCLTRNEKHNYPSQLAKDAGCTYSHTVHLLQKFELIKLVTFEKDGRLKLVHLTKKGEKIAELFKDLERAF
jgi:DNA-binding MarR family transcriptional regulator